MAASYSDRDLDFVPHFTFPFVENYIKSVKKSSGQKIFNKGFKYFHEGYYQDLKVKLINDDSEVTGKCYRSQKRNEPPHQLKVLFKDTLSSVPVITAKCSLYGQPPFPDMPLQNFMQNFLSIALSSKQTVAVENLKLSWPQIKRFEEQTRQDGLLKLKRNHAYYYQILTQLAVTGLDWCDFFVWCAYDHYLETIYFNEDVWQLVKNKVYDFYFSYFL